MKNYQKQENLNHSIEKNSDIVGAITMEIEIQLKRHPNDPLAAPKSLNLLNI